MANWRIIPRATHDELGEGTLWSAADQSIYWVDILAPALNRLSLVNDEVTRWQLPEPLGWVVERDKGGFIAGFKSGFAELDVDPLTIRMIGNPEPHLPGNRMNDGKADAAGRIWCGTMDESEGEPSGSLYRLAADRSWRPMDTGYGVPNGPAFSPDGNWLYHTDSARRRVYRFRLTPEGDLRDREDFIEFSEEDGYPDGMTVDSDGGIWIAHWDGGCVSRFDPDGRRERAIRLPARRITNIAFAGEGLDRMFVSSAAVGLDSHSSEDGALFEVEADAVGLPPGLFKG